MADPVDELEVLVSLDLGPLEDDLEEAVDEMQRLDDQQTDDVQDELDDAAESADDLSNSIDDADARAIEIDVDDSEVQAAENAVEDLDGKEANVDVDVDESGGVGGGRGGRTRLPGELDEVAEVGMAFSELTGTTKGLITAAGAAVAAIGAAGGLAAAATKLSKSFGDAEVRQEVNALMGELDTLGAVMAQEFRPVVESQVVPAAKNLADSLASAADEAAAFAEVIIGALRPGGGGIREDVEESGAGGATFLPTVGPTPTPGPQAQRDTPLSNIKQPGLSNVAGSLKQIVGSLQRLEGFGGSLGEALKRADLLEAAGLPKEQVIETRISALESARKSVSELAKQAEKGTPAFDVLAGEVSDIQAALEEARATLKQLSRVSLEGVAPQPADAEEVEGAGREGLDTPSIDENVPDRIPDSQVPDERGEGGLTELQEQAREARRAMRQVQRRIRQSISTMSTFGQIGTNAAQRVAGGIGQAVTAFTTFGDEIISLKQRFKNFGKAVLRSLNQVISKLAATAAQAAILTAILPGFSFGSGGFGSIFKALSGIPGAASGGVVEQGGLARIHKGETIVPADVTQGVSGMGANVNVNVTGQTRTDGRDLVTSYDTSKRVQRRKGHSTR